MRAIIQRVSSAQVIADGTTTGSIGQGLLILLGVEENDTIEDVQWLAHKITSLRIFNDETGAMNLGVSDVNGELLVVSQFTLFASYKKGNRPSFIKAARPGLASKLYEQFCHTIAKMTPLPVQTGVFGAAMQVTLCNDGPVTILIDTKQKE